MSKLKQFCNKYDPSLVTDEGDEFNPITAYKQMIKQLASFALFTDRFCDVQFQLMGDNDSKAHRVILYCGSAYFKAILASGMKETNATQIDFPETAPDFQLLKEFLYRTESIIFRKFEVFNEKSEKHIPTTAYEVSILPDVLVLANKYQIPELVKVCEAEIISEGVLLHDIFDLLQVAELHNAQQLKRYILHYIKVNYYQSKKHKKFKQLSKEAKEEIKREYWPGKKYEEDLESFKKQVAQMKKDKQSCSIQ